MISVSPSDDYTEMMWKFKLVINGLRKVQLINWIRCTVCDEFHVTMKDINGSWKVDE